MPQPHPQPQPQPQAFEPYATFRPSRTRITQVTTTLVQPDNGILTSSQAGLGGTNEVRSIIQDNIAAWGSCSTASEFYDKWFESPRKDLEAAGLLTEHFKQSDLGVSCAASANAALEENKEGKFDTTNDKIAEYISKSGAWPAEKNGIKTVRSLLDMMMITGVIHGAWLLALSPTTLRVTRSTLVPTTP